MEPEYDPTAYGAALADVYDELYGDDVLDTEGAVERLRQLADGGPVLELGIGTGRLALPLADGGLQVHGIDASADMLDRLRAKPEGAKVSLIQADFSDFELAERFSLAILAFNTVFALPSQDAQVRCFERVAFHLQSEGCFVVEAFVPNPARFVDGQSVRLRAMSAGRVALDVARIDPATQFMHTTQVHLRDGGVRLYPANHRYAWPSELDLMARLAGMELEDRWQDWRGTPFGSTSQFHVSVYRKRRGDDAARRITVP